MSEHETGKSQARKNESRRHTFRDSSKAPRQAEASVIPDASSWEIPSRHDENHGFCKSRKNSRLPASPKIGEAQRLRSRSPWPTAQAMLRPRTLA
jgi:hypothetical protein